MLIFPPVTAEVQEIIKVAVLWGESELSVWCQQRLNSNYKRHNTTHLLYEKARNLKTAISACRNGYIFINQCHTKLKYINQY